MAKVAANEPKAPSTQVAAIMERPPHAVDAANRRLTRLARKALEGNQHDLVHLVAHPEAVKCQIDARMDWRLEEQVRRESKAAMSR